MSTDRQHARVSELVKLDEAHTRGFDQGRRWAAEELLRIAAREIRLQSSWLWHQLGESKLTEFCADLGRRLIAEIYDPEPRTWALPTIPEDVEAVRDEDGMIWYRHRHGPGWWNEDGDRLPTAQLLAAGRVTEILPGEFEEPEVLEDNRG